MPKLISSRFKGVAIIAKIHTHTHTHARNHTYNYALTHTRSHTNTGTEDKKVKTGDLSSCQMISFNITGQKTKVQTSTLMNIFKSPIWHPSIVTSQYFVEFKFS